jgi:hypothetical protein
MATPRKRKSSFGPRVDGPVLGRPVRGVEHVREVAARVRAVRDRIDSESKSKNPVLRLTRRSFGRRIGLSDDDAQAEKAVRFRHQATDPTPYTAEELSKICDEFGVRAEYLLRGHGPMLVTDLGETSISAPVRFSWTLRERLIRVVATSLDQDEDWVDSHLPDPDSLLIAVEQGVAAGLAANASDRIENHRRANASVREAISAHVRANSNIPEVTPEFLKSATEGIVAGTVIDLGQRREAKETESPPTES